MTFDEDEQDDEGEEVDVDEALRQIRGGRTAYLKLPEGETHLTLIAGQKPRRRVNLNFKQHPVEWLFRVVVEGSDVENTLSAREHSPLAEGLALALSEGRTKVRVIRAGMGDKTRWAVK